MRGVYRWMVVAGLLTSIAVAAPRPRTWSSGTVAKGADRVLKGVSERIEVPLPADLARRIKRPTYLIYFSPGCSHCQRAQPDFNELSTLVKADADVIGISSGAASAIAMGEFKAEYSVNYDIIHDEDGSISAALGARSTPSVMLVGPDDVGKILVKEAWFPYRRGTLTLLRMASMSNPWAAFEPGAYQGTTTCSGCHIEETESWMLSHHSVAWETIVKQNAEDKEECVQCHVVGYGEPTGFSLGGSVYLTDVGCESCHGPGGPHDGARADPKESCEACHDREHSISFSLDKGMPLIDHFVASTIDEAAFRKELRALHNGEKERKLLAFDAADLVGSAACASCHEQETAWWNKDAHSSAMTTLAGKVHDGRPASEEVVCVRCHASPVATGPQPTAVSKFLRGESVGCESCHGPGGAHVAAKGGKDNIEGLGDDCPVCVLEAVCTTCHTSEWDPGWSLDTRLKAITHGRTSSVKPKEKR
ncbi:MAG: hypothetical protein ACI9MC_001284 [Kiritimatiellia bacterium]|jgi:hypothetical protein